MRNYLNRALSTLILAFIMSFANANTTISTALSPSKIMEQATTKILQRLQAKEDLSDTDIDALIDDISRTYFDFRTMTKLAVAKYWRKANASQRDQLTSEFKKLLTRTYRNTIRSTVRKYNGQAIEFMPARYNKNKQRALVKATVEIANSEKVVISFKLIHKKDADVWQIYDVEISGISLVTNYRNTFKNIIGNSGIDGLIKSLKEKNNAQAKTTTVQDS